MGDVVEELPKSIVRRVVKEKLSQFSDAGDISLHKDALLAFSESARVFIHYLSATANELCKESKRQTVNADDVLKAVEEIDFPEFLGPLRASLEDFRQKNAKKRAGAAKSKEVNKKRKQDVPHEDERSIAEVEANNGDNANDQEHQKDLDEEGTKVADNELQDDADKGGVEDEDNVGEHDQHDVSDNEEKDSEDAVAVEDREEEDDGSIRSNEQQNDADEEDNSINDDDGEGGAMKHDISPSVVVAE